MQCIRVNVYSATSIFSLALGTPFNAASITPRLRRRLLRSWHCRMRAAEQVRAADAVKLSYDGGAAILKLKCIAQEFWNTAELR